MADTPTKASDVGAKKSSTTKSSSTSSQPVSVKGAPSDVTGRTIKSVDAAPKPGEPIDNPTASAATGEHPEPTKKNEPTFDAATGKQLGEK